MAPPTSPPDPRDSRARLRDIVSTGTFRFSAVAAALSGLTTLLLFAFIYWQTAGYETRRIDSFLSHEAEVLAEEPATAIVRDVDLRYAADLHRATFAALFDAAGRPIAGDLRARPALPVDAAPHWAVVERRTASGITRESALVLARHVPGGTLLVGRSAGELRALRAQVLRALAVGLIPGMLLALALGALLGRRSLARIRALNAAVGRIMDGNVAERLPVHGTRDALDQLAASVNRMLSEIERLIGEIAGVGDDIAHDLRTPLTRLRARLEGGLRRSPSLAALAEIVEAGMADLDQTFTTITALLRIGEISGTGRRAGFSEVSLAPILQEAADLYQPIAEERGIAIAVQAEAGLRTHGDRDLLFEAVANLLDNAIKFAPERSTVRLQSGSGADGPVLRVADAGRGIPGDEREAVLRRFYRADRSRGGAGHGLGLSIVIAILRLHGFRLAMCDTAEGFAVDVVCREAPGTAEATSLTRTDSNGS